MNNHDNFRDDIEAYALETLDPDERQVFERHLHDCEPCSRQVESYGVVLEKLHGLPVPLAPPRPTLQHKSSNSTRYAALAAALVGFVVLASQVPKIVQYQHAEQEYAAIAHMMATNPQEVALVGKSGVSGRAIVGDARQRTGFIASGLPVAHSGMVYRVWVSGPHTRFSPGTLERTPDGLMVLVIHGDSLRNAANVHISLEPAQQNSGKSQVVLNSSSG